MNRSIEVLKEIYKPYKYSLVGDSTILYSTSGNVVIKPSNEEQKDLFNYLASRNFNYYPKIIDSKREDVLVYEFIEDTKMAKEQRALDLIKVVANLHTKTAYYKEVSQDKFTSIYEDIKNNILYLKDYYQKLFDEYYNHVYMSPKEYILMRNFTKIMSALNFCESELDKWYDLVKDLKKQRVCLIHNNLMLDHFLKNKGDYLISWNHAEVDTPILDLVTLYHNEYYNIAFEPILSKYLEIFPLNQDEEKLLFILISMPWQVKEENTELQTCTNYTKLIDYIYKTEQLIRPYYPEK